jgi:hypothetical protein
MGGMVTLYRVTMASGSNWPACMVTQRQSVTMPPSHGKFAKVAGGPKRGVQLYGADAASDPPKIPIIRK